MSIVVATGVLFGLGLVIVVLLVCQYRAAVAGREQHRRYVVSEAARLTDGQLRITALLNTIHALVNSNMTAAMQAEWDALLGQLALMDEVADLKRVAGKSPAPQALASAEAVRAKLAELSAALRERGQVPGSIRFPQGPPQAD